MLKKKVQKHFSSVSILLVALMLLASSCLSQQAGKKDNCYILAGGKQVQLFINLPALRKKISVSKDIEHLDKLVFLYSYDDKIRKVNGYSITPQILFYVDTSTKQTVKEEIYYDIERKKTNGNIKKEDLKKLLNIVKRQNIPFADSPENPDFGNTYKLNSACHPYSVEISKVKDEYSNTWQQFVIKILVVK